nr:MAG TPA: hypothetical protein [Caudoviricetes sp.]
MAQYMDNIVCRKTIRNTKTTQRGVKRIYPERN